VFGGAAFFRNASGHSWCKILDQSEWMVMCVLGLGPYNFSKPSIVFKNIKQPLFLVQEAHHSHDIIAPGCYILLCLVW